MSETEETSPLLQRLAVDRLAAPGVLDRSRIHRLHDRLSSPSRIRSLDRLNRRAIPGTPSAPGLYLARVDRATAAAYPEAGPATAASPSAMTGGEHSIPVRRAPGVLRTSDFVAKLSATVDGGSRAIARAAAPAKSGIGVLQRKPASDSASAYTAAPAAGVESIAKGVDRFHVTSAVESQRATENASTSAAVAGGAVIAARGSSSSEHLAPAKPVIPILWRKIDAAPVAGAKSVVQHPPTESGRQAVADSARYGSDLPIAVERPAAAIVSRQRDQSLDSPTYAADPVVRAMAAPSLGHTRTPGATDITGAVMHPTSISGTAAASPVVARAQSGRPSGDLILRKSVPGVTSPQAASRLQTSALGAAPGEARSSIPTPLWRKAESVDATLGSTLAATASQAMAPAQNAVYSPAPSPGTSPGTPMGIDIDWVTEQVGNRLARRLEVERERLGVRRWRQAN